ncbi:MAG: cytochrome C oxidase subunit II [Proteobacteria bacterium]|nr:MAG: cytochrome C oxidase subunit II [Pseudomonadota bacterium]
MAAILVLLLAVVVFTSLHWGMQPPSSVETIDSTRLQLGGEFAEANLGTSVGPNGAVTIRLLAQQYAFVPKCILVPADTPVTLRAVSADVVHGFLVQGTNVNTMVVPGYVATLSTRFSQPGDFRMPCHEFCGVGHQGMWAQVRVVARDQFPFDQANKGAVNCAQH